MDMERKGTMGVRFRAVFMLAILFCVMFMGRTGIAAEDDSQSGSKAFDIDAQLLSSDEMTFDIQLTISNQGEDWEGAVRVQMHQQYDSTGCAYDTVLSLPQGSTKRFVVRIPVSAVNGPVVYGRLDVSVLDKDGDVRANKSFGNFLLQSVSSLSLGILSDSYTSLTFLDLGGESIYYDRIELPINLVELELDDLAESLDLLSYLVIDNYDTSVLTRDVLDQITQWISDGGMLIVGTGEHAKETLSGLDFLNVECIQVMEPGARIHNDDYGAGLETLASAELKDTDDRYDVDADSLVMLSSWGNGAVEIVPYALYDLDPNTIIENWECTAWDLLQDITQYIKILPQITYYASDDYTIRNIFESFGNGSDRLNFGFLKVIVAAYVIFAGPILYLILRAMKKRDWYWWAVPVTVLVGILLVYLTGRGFEVVDTRVYSVTVERLSDECTEGGVYSDAVTYLHCYDADYREWGLRLAERYDYAGPVFEVYRYYLYGNTDDKYYSHICREGDRISLGIDPQKGFEDAYFLAGTSQKMGTGSITSELTSSSQRGIAGTVTNETSRDFERFAVIADDKLFVFGNLPAGETYFLGNPIYSSRRAGDTSVMSAVRSYMLYDTELDYDTIAALGTGICEMYTREAYTGGVMIIGVTKDWDKTVDDACNETAFGCLYTVQCGEVSYVID